MSGLGQRPTGHPRSQFGEAMHVHSLGIIIDKGKNGLPMREKPANACAAYSLNKLG
jgi:hypothetical protein